MRKTPPLIRDRIFSSQVLVCPPQLERAWKDPNAVGETIWYQQMGLSLPAKVDISIVCGSWSSTRRPWSRLTMMVTVYIATCRRHLDCLRFLAEHKASLDQADRYHGSTPVYRASQNGHLDCLRVLAEHKASLEQANINGWTPVFIASCNGHLDCLRFLAEHKASLEKANINGCTPVSIAFREGHLDCLRFLAEQGVPGALQQMECGPSTFCWIESVLVQLFVSQVFLNC